jgi:DNA integrity scanning protein DisA with diadenylate cyclase activity
LATALIYLKLAKLNYKEDPEGKLVIQDAKNDKTEIYINHALKALSSVNDQELTKQAYVFAAKYYLRKK